MNDTENNIKEATINLLLKDGNFGFTLLDVAKKSNVKRTVIHYYFRSRDSLMTAMTNEIINKLVRPRYDTLQGEESLKVKSLNFLKASDAICKTYPYIDLFLMLIHTTSPDLQRFLVDMKTSFKKLIFEIQEAIDHNLIKYQAAEQFLMDLFSFSSFSYIFSNFLCKIDTEAKYQYDLTNCTDKNKRIINMLFHI